MAPFKCNFFQTISIVGVVALFLLIHSDCQMTPSRDQHVYTQKEIQAINELRPSVEKYLTLDYQKSDGYLLTFIRGRKFDLQKAETDMEKLYKSRKENRIDTLLDENVFLPPSPYTLDGFDKSGRPILILNFGKWNFRHYALTGGQEKFERHYRASYERAIRKAFQTAKESGKDIYQFFLIVDAQGYSPRTHTCLGCVPIMLKFATIFATDVYYFTYKFIGVNVPRIFLPVLSLIKAIISGIKIEDYDSDKSVWQKALLQDIAADQLPLYLGGTKKAMNPVNKNATVHQ